MKPLFPALALLALCAPPAAFAGGLDGPYVQGLLGVNRGSLHDNLDGSKSGLRAVGQISAGSTRTYGESELFNLGVGFFYTAGRQSFASADSAGASARYTVKDAMGLTFEPGLNLGTNALLYTKLGYVKATVDARRSDAAGASTSAGNGYDGIIYGLGAKVRLSETVYGVAEIQQYAFNKKEDVKPASLGAYVGVGYRF